MNKSLLCIAMVTFLTGCITKIDQPPPDLWEHFYKHKKRDTPSFEIIKQDILACGFDNPHSGYIKSDDEHDTQFINAMLCMERKGYRNSAVEEPTICLTRAFKNKPACQSH